MHIFETGVTPTQAKFHIFLIAFSKGMRMHFPVCSKATNERAVEYECSCLVFERWLLAWHITMILLLPCLTFVARPALQIMGLAFAEHLFLLFLSSVLLASLAGQCLCAQVLLNGTAPQQYVALLTPASALALAEAMPKVELKGEESPLQSIAQHLAAAAHSLSAHKAWLHSTATAALAIAVAQVHPQLLYVQSQLHVD